MFSIFQGRRPDIAAARRCGLRGGGGRHRHAPDRVRPRRPQRRPAGRALRGAHLVGDPRRPADRRRRHAARGPQPRRRQDQRRPGKASPDDGLEDPATDFEEDDAAPVSDDEEFYADSELQALEAAMPVDNPDYVGVTRDEHRLRWDRADQGVRGLPVRGPPDSTSSGGVWTIGYGHTEGVGPHSPRLTERQASELLERDLARRYEGAVEALPTAHLLNQNQFDALVVFVYNVGGGAHSPPTPGSAGRCAPSSGTGRPTRCCAGTGPKVTWSKG